MVGGDPPGPAYAGPLTWKVIQRPEKLRSSGAPQVSAHASGQGAAGSGLRPRQEGDTAMRSQVTIATIAGIDIRVHPSWLIIALLITVSFWTRFSLLEVAAPTALVMAVVAAVLFFSSVLVHELAHALEARHRDVEVHRITLFLFGGAAEMDSDIPRPRDEFALTAVGPFASFVLAAVFGLVATYAGQAGIEVVAQVAGLLGWVNLALGVFNLLPGAPLDGGRILRSLVWAATGDRQRATRVAAATGQVLGFALIATGVLQFFLVPAGFLGGIWFVILGWFLAAAARNEAVQARLQEALGELTLGELVSDRPLPEVAADAGVPEVAARLRRSDEDAVQVRDERGHTAVLTIDTVADAARTGARGQLVRDLATPLEELRSVPADARLSDRVSLLAAEEPVVVTAQAEGGPVLGILTAGHLQRVATRALRFGTPPAPEGPGAGDGHLPAQGSDAEVEGGDRP